MLAFYDIILQGGGQALSASIYNVDVAEAASATDSVASTAIFAADLTESASATDDLNFVDLIFEAASATDTLAAALIRSGVIEERAGARESTLTGIVEFGVCEIVEAASATDEVSVPAWVKNTDNSRTWSPNSSANSTWTKRSPTSSTWTEN